MKKVTILAIVILIAILAFAVFLLNKNFTGNAVSMDNQTCTNNTVYMTLFYGQGCPHCAQLEAFLDTLQTGECPYLNITRYEVYSHQDNRVIWANYSKAYNSEISGVPTLFIDDKVIVGYNSEIGNQIKQEILRCRQEGCINPADKVSGESTQITGNKSSPEKPGVASIKKSLTIPAVIAGAFVDSLNPCEFAVLIMLMTTILVSGNRKRALLAGLSFTFAIFLSYFLMGLGIYSAIQASGISRTFFIIVSVLAIIIGLFNLKDYFWYGKWFLMEVPLSWRPLMKRILTSVASVPGAFIVGIVISVILLPCTSGPYIVILGLLSSLTTKMSGILFLFLYNFVFVLPMLIITLLIYFGITSTEKAEEWRTRKLKVLHLITGIIILILGIGMIISIVFGWI